jgi:hypothetical protein
MRLGVLVERREHDGQYDFGVVTDEGHDVLVVPVIQRSLRDLLTYFTTTITTRRLKI